MSIYNVNNWTNKELNSITMGNKLKNIVFYPFKIIAYQIIFGNYIDKKWKEKDTCHKFKNFLKEYRNNIGQLIELDTLENLYEVFYYTYNIQDIGEFDELNIKFYNKDLELLYHTSLNNAG